MNTFAMLALAAPQIEKFSALMDSRRIFKSRVQTAFEAAAKITPQLEAAATERMKAVMDTPSMLVMRALMPVNPLAGRL